MAEQAKKQQVAALKGRVNALIKEQKYKEAVDVLEEIRRLDPKDQEAARRLEEYKTFVKLLEDDQSYGWPDFYLRPNVVPWYKLVHPLHRSSTATQPANE